ncbi:hypothetical protein PENCOP_c007G01561 [Penicillium coprophilum]|uniref:Aflatoxin regulatory protein domain-containing protein n=1 Tax=Penicillium coprophilum TaxID=36646 RepID=A0A1V6UKL1_9EURO|nr:hypothetical protein PENCOP_c007G01561 [Penicillium coprophilum]
MGSGDASTDDLGHNLNVNIDPDIYLDTFPESHPLFFGTASELCSAPVPHVVSDGSNGHDDPMLDWSTLPGLSVPVFAAPDSILAPFQTPSPPAAAAVASCLSQRRVPCIITATQSLRSLHVPQTSCISRQSVGGHDSSGPEPPRLSGSVLKSNKDAGMSVCRMLQCACALRPQNQLILAIICSRLIAWYRAMIRVCFVNSPRNFSRHMNTRPNDNPTSLEKVVHQPVTIGDHSVDDQALGLIIQAQVMSGELQHMQRLVETLSARMRETANSGPKGMQTFRAEAGLPGIAHDRLVGHLMKEVHAAKTDLITALETA